MPGTDYWQSMLRGYLLTVLIETSVLWWGLSPRHPSHVRVWAGVWLTAGTYPFVWLVFPPLFPAGERGWYLLTAEIFAPACEAWMFWGAFVRHRVAPDGAAMRRDMLAIVAANLCSFVVGTQITV